MLVESGHRIKGGRYSGSASLYISVPGPVAGGGGAGGSWPRTGRRWPV
ncbi:hypothetical protein [Thermogymnomonas acidicola]|nr:hypothetical protein [Thermogymnomonas acidicola]